MPHICRRPKHLTVPRGYEVLPASPSYNGLFRFHDDPFRVLRAHGGEQLFNWTRIQETQPMPNALGSLNARKKLTDHVITRTGRVEHGEMRGAGNDCDLGSGSHGGVFPCGLGPALIELAGVKQNW